MSGTKVTPSDNPKCPQCGTPLPAGALAGLCPACLLKQGAADETATGGQSPPFQPPPLAELAAKFPQLEILELIGKGGMGAVYKARQKELDRIVALKILPPGIGDDPAFAGRFAREARALAKLNHPGIVTLYEFGVVAGVPPAVEPGILPGGKGVVDSERAANSGAAPGGKMPPSTSGGTPDATKLYYFLMEFVDGVNLRQLLHAGRIAPREALAIVPQICDALQYAHDQGIVHRDIKPENILLDRRGRVKVADFGLVKLVGNDGRAELPLGQADQQVGPTNLTAAGKVMGTPNYMAPEQKEHPDAVDHRADIYALGVVFYQMLTGELPGQRIEPPSSRMRGMEMDVRLDEIVLRALEKKPELRYQQVSVFKTQVETIATTPSSGGQRNFFSSEGANPPPLSYWGVPTTRFTRAIGVVTGIFIGFWILLLSFVYFGYPRESGIFSYVGSGFLIWMLVVAVDFFFCARQSKGNRTTRRLLQGLAVLACVIFTTALVVDRFHLKESKSVKSDYIGQAWFPGGDSIEITSVERSTDRMVVKGHYNLVSHDNALLALYCTSTNRNVHEEATQRMQVSKGRGDFELSRSNLYPGLHHVSMYADGRSFAALYFGTQAEALEESKAKWIAETNPTSDDALEPTLATSAFQIRLAAEDSETNVVTDLFTNTLDDAYVERLRLFKTVLMDGTAIEQAGWYLGSNGKQELMLALTEAGKQRFAELTAANLHRRIAIVFQGRVLLAPVIQSPISSPTIELPVNWNKKDLERTVNGLNQMKNQVADLRFGPEQENVLPPLKGPDWSFLNLRANRLVAISSTESGTRHFHDWQQDNNADLAAPISEKFPALRGYGMVITTADTNGWDTSSPSDIWYNWNLMVNEPKAEVHLAKAPGKASGIYYFRTRDDTWGILQIIGFTKKPGTNFMENPSSVRVRYKLVQNGSQPSGDGLESKAFTAQFLQGQIGLLGVSRLASSNSNSTWWRPDGSISSQTFETEWNYPPANDSIVQLVFKTQRFPDRSAFFYKVLPETCSTRGRTSEVRSGGKRVPGCDAMFVNIPKPDATNALKQFTVQIGVASGMGTVISTRGPQGGSSEVTSLPDGTRFHLMTTSPIEGKDFVSLTYSSSPLAGWNANITAVDSDGNIHEAVSSESADDELTSTEVRFDGLKLSDVKEFRFAVRKYEWMEFSNISLLPGHRTDAEVRNVVKEQKQEELVQNGDGLERTANPLPSTSAIAADEKNNPEAATLPAIQTWLGLMDSGQYAESWRQASDSFRALVAQDEWVNKGESIRKPLGKLLSRKLEKVEPSGPLFVAKFDSSFEALKAATETVTFALETNGQWRAAGYFIRPRSDTNNAAVEPAQAWLQAIDNGRYAQSWTNAAVSFQSAVTPEKWVESMQAFRQPLGSLISRKVISAQEMSSLPGAPDGRYIVMQFETSFTNKQSAVETVTFMLEKDGQWRAAGYYIK